MYVADMWNLLPLLLSLLASLLCTSQGCHPRKEVGTAPMDLSPDEQALVKETIDLISPDLGEHAINIFMALFKAKPEYQQLFHKFKDTPYEALPKDEFLVQHSKNILAKFASAVGENVGSGEAMVDAFKQIAELHVARGVSLEHVKILRYVVLRYLAEKLGSKMSPQRAGAWQKVFVNVLGGFRAVLEPRPKREAWIMF